MSFACYSSSENFQKYWLYFKFELSFIFFLDTFSLLPNLPNWAIVSSKVPACEMFSLIFSERFLLETVLPKDTISSTNISNLHGLVKLIYHTHVEAIWCYYGCWILRVPFMSRCFSLNNTVLHIPWKKPYFKENTDATSFSNLTIPS